MEACLTSTFTVKLQQMVNYSHFKISITYHHFIQTTSLQGIMQVIALEFQIHVWSPTIGIGNWRCRLHFIESLAKRQPVKVLRIFIEVSNFLWFALLRTRKINYYTIFGLQETKSIHVKMSSWLVEKQGLICGIDWFNHYNIINNSV